MIHAAKAGHKSIVEALLKKYADVDMTGKVLPAAVKILVIYFDLRFQIVIIIQERKTALYWAVEKNHISVVKSLLNSDPNLEISTKVKVDITSLNTLGAFLMINKKLGWRYTVVESRSQSKYRNCTAFTGQKSTCYSS